MEAEIGTRMEWSQDVMWNRELSASALGLEIQERTHNPTVNRYSGGWRPRMVVVCSAQMQGRVLSKVMPTKTHASSKPQTACRYRLFGQCAEGATGVLH